MNSEELRKLQAPLKQQYRDHPESSIITLKAQGEIGEGISCKVETVRTCADQINKIYLKKLIKIRI